MLISEKRLKYFLDNNKKATNPLRTSNLLHVDMILQIAMAQLAISYLRVLKLQNQLIVFLDKFSILVKVADDIRMSNLKKPDGRN
jgi:hypothetical protein